MNIYEIAKCAGVSPATVSRVLNGTAPVKAETRLRVLQVVQEQHEVPQTVSLYRKNDIPGGIRKDDIVLHSYEECMREPRLHADNFRHVEEESNKLRAQRLLQQTGQQWVVVNPPFPPLTQEELDHSFDLPYTRLPHPKYKGKRIPAYEMIKFSVCMHRGCFGGCAFCTISAHQGKFIMSRSKESILKEVEAITRMPDFKGYLSDLGGPSANMYMMHGRNPKACQACKRPSCIHPQICPNLNGDHRPLLDIYRAVDALPGIQTSFIGSPGKPAPVPTSITRRPFMSNRARGAALSRKCRRAVSSSPLIAVRFMTLFVSVSSS